MSDIRLVHCDTSYMPIGSTSCIYFHCLAFKIFILLNTMCESENHILTVFSSFPLISIFTLHFKSVELGASIPASALPSCRMARAHIINMLIRPSGLPSLCRHSQAPSAFCDTLLHPFLLLPSSTWCYLSEYLFGSIESHLAIYTLILWFIYTSIQVTGSSLVSARFLPSTPSMSSLLPVE